VKALHPTARSGFSVIELAVSMSLLALVLAIAMQFGDAVSSGSSTATAAAEADASASRALAAIADRVEDSGTGWFSAALGAPFSSSDLTYDRVVGWDEVGGVPATVVEQIVLEPSPTDPDNGLDDDGDGTIDDCVVVWIRDPGGANERQVICRGVPELLAGEIAGNGLDDNGNGLLDERGLAFDFFGSGLRVQLSVVERDKEGRALLRTVQRSVWFRNQAASQK
jgi:prepilin-type N-terminal cleavage/methylation domain-containing protein